MAVYRNKNDDTIFYGGEFKLKVSMDTIGGHNMEDVNFKCTFSTGKTEGIGLVVIITNVSMYRDVHHLRGTS